MRYLVLHPKDQEKYGAPERIPFDLAEIGIRQRTAFEEKTKKPYNWLLDHLRGVPELDEAGNAVPVQVFNPDGSPKLDDNNEPVMRMKLTRHPETMALLAWLALWGHGIRVPWNDKDGNPAFDIIEHGAYIGADTDDEDEEEAEEGDEGKAPTDSETTTSPTTSPTE